MSGSTLTLPEVIVTAKRETPDPPVTKPATTVTGAPAPYIKRKIDVTITLGTGNFGEQGKNVVTLRGRRVSATVQQTAGNQPKALSCRIFGMKFDIMKKLSTLGLLYGAQRHNGIRIDAGNDVDGMQMVFEGTLQDAYLDGESQPQVAFQVTGFESFIHQIKPAPPISQAGSVDVAEVMQGLAKQMGVTFENNGVTAKLRDIYYPGTAMQQMRRIAEHAGIGAIVEDGKLAIWPRGQGRNTSNIPLITPLSGMKNYPQFNSMGYLITCAFRPLKFNQQVKVQSSLWDNNSRPMFVSGITHTLESEMPNGPWFTTFLGTVRARGPG